MKRSLPSYSSREFAVELTELLFSPQAKMRRPTVRLGLMTVLLLWANTVGFGAQVDQARNVPERPPDPPYRNVSPGVAYVGSAKCGTCHISIYESFRKTGMGRSMSSADTPGELARVRSPVTIFDHNSNLHFDVSRQGSSLFQSEYRLDATGKEEFRRTEKLAYVIGSGVVGYTYIVERGQYFFEAPLSFYSQRESWDLSPGFESQNPGFTRPIVSVCVACHSGQPQPASPRTTPGAFFEPFRGSNPPFAELSIGCENCHGPGQLHVQERLKGLPASHEADFSIVNPAKLAPWMANNICMSCHQGSDVRVLKPGHQLLDFRPGTALDKTVAMLQEPLSPASAARSPLLGHYVGMILSKCYMESGGKLSCITCHDPHVERPSDEKAAYFRNKCLTCHSDESCKLPVSARIARKASDDCAGCHMHKQGVTIIPHIALTDHRITATEGEPYPDAAFHLTTPNLPDLIYLDAEPDHQSETLPPETLLEAYVQAVKKDPATYRAHYLTVLDEVSKSEPDNLLVLSELAQRELSKGEADSPRKATEYLQRAVKSGSDNPADYLRLSILLDSTNQVAESVSILNQGLRLSPYNRLFYEFLTERYLSMQEHQDAVDTAQRGLRLFPEDTTLQSLLEKANSAAPSPKTMPPQ